MTYVILNYSKGLLNLLAMSRLMWLLPKDWPRVRHSSHMCALSSPSPFLGVKK